MTRKEPEWSDLKGKDILIGHAKEQIKKGMLMMIGPCGSGKTIIARMALAEHVKNKQADQYLYLNEKARFLGSNNEELWKNPQFRAPHHTVSKKGILQEFLMASGGVLYLDEFSAFKPEAIQAIHDAIILFEIPIAPLVIFSEDACICGEKICTCGSMDLIRHYNRILDVCNMFCIDKIFDAESQLEIKEKIKSSLIGL